MQRTAQKRSLLNKLREMTNISGIAAEKTFNPEFQELMDNLRDKTDDPVRAIVSGQQIGMAPAPDDAASLKDLLKSVKSNINRREYMRAVADLGRFHKKMYDVITILSSFKVNVDKIHEKFLFEGLDEESRRHLRELKSRVARVNNKNLIKNANMLEDFFANFATKRGKALAAWEKRYPKQTSKLKYDTQNLLKSSERLLSITLSSLKEMATARATRNPDNYLRSADKIIKAYQSYDEVFKKYYSENIKGFLEKQDLIVDVDKNIMPETSKPTVDVTPKGEPVIIPNIKSITPTSIPPLPPVPQYSKDAPYSITHPGQIPPPVAIPQFKEPLPVIAPPPLPTEPGFEFKTDKDQPPVAQKKLPMRPPQKKSHKNFIESLESMAGESVILLSAHISRYAKSILSSDPETSIKLFKLAKSIKE